MKSVRITGGMSLKGEVIPQGAKNEALQVLSAVLLTDDKITINNIPDIIDVNKLIEILKNLGVTCSNLKNGSYEFSAKKVNLDYLKSDASIPRPGGDKIGRRRLDTHFVNLEKLGAKLDYDSKNRIYNVKTNGLIGVDLLLDEASVTGTANLIMASVLAKGDTRIYNAACEPYIQQLCSMLIKMGANIQGIGSNLLTISGVEKLNGATHTILPDMIEIGSWIGLAAMTKSEIRIKNVSWENLGQIPNTFRKLGIKILKEGDDMIIPSHNDGYEISNYIDGSILTISDAPWPGFSPDLISIILVVATQARGSILVHQKMFESRLFFVDKLIDMGAKIILSDPHRASVIGLDFKSELKATVMSSPDIRAGIALLIAALSANGTSVIQNVEQIDRGYENIVKRLNQLGAEIERI